MPSRKQITFDLDTNALQKYYPSNSWRNAYEVIKTHMKNNGFSWIQGSAYVSDKAISSTKVAAVLQDLVTKNPWLNICMRDCRETNIGKEHSRNILFDKSANVPTRAELKARGPQGCKSSMNEWGKKIDARRSITKMGATGVVPNAKSRATKEK